MDLKEIIERKKEIRSILESGKDCDLVALEAELKSLNAKEEELNKRSEIANSINLGKVEARAIEKPVKEIVVEDKFDTMEYRKGFMDYVLNRANQTLKTTDAGAAIPTTVMNKIIDRMEESGIILPLVTRTAYKGGVTIPTSGVRPVATWTAEGKGSDTQKETLGSVTFAYHKLRCAVAVSLEVDTMSIPAFEAMIVKHVSQAMVKALEAAIINGTGVGQPKGILTETGVDVQATTLDYATVVKAESELAAEYEAGAVWVMSKKAFGELLNERDAQKQPIARVNYGMAGKPERLLLGRQVVLTEHMPAVATATVGAAIAFIFDMGDYVLNSNLGVTIKRYEDNLTDDQVTKGIMLVDGKVVSTESLIKVVKK